MFIEILLQAIVAAAGTSALIVYLLQKRSVRRNAAFLIVEQIDNLKHDIANISTFVSKYKALDGVAFYESIPLFGKDQWQNNKHLFISSLDRESIRSIDKFYSLAHIINKQQDLITNLQNNHFFLVQKLIKWYRK